MITWIRSLPHLYQWYSCILASFPGSRIQTWQSWKWGWSGIFSHKSDTNSRIMVVEFNCVCAYPGAQNSRKGEIRYLQTYNSFQLCHEKRWSLGTLSRFIAHILSMNTNKCQWTRLKHLYHPYLVYILFGIHPYILLHF